MKRVHEYEIVSSLKKGDMVVVFKKYWRRLCYFSQGLVGNKQEAEDVATDSLIKLYKKRNDFDNNSDISGFLFNAARHACFDILKHRRVVDKHVNYKSINSEDSDDYINAKIVQTEAIASLCKVAEQLPKERKKVFQLLFIDGLNANEAAAKLKIKVDTVRVQRSRIIEYFKSQLKCQVK